MTKAVGFSAATKARRHDRELRTQHRAAVAVAELAQTLCDDACGDVVGEYGAYLAACKAVYPGSIPGAASKPLTGILPGQGLF